MKNMDLNTSDRAIILGRRNQGSIKSKYRDGISYGFTSGVSKGSNVAKSKSPIVYATFSLKIKNRER